MVRIAKRRIEPGTVAVVKSLAEHREKQGLSVMDIAKAEGMFPSDVEEALKELKEKDAVECYIYRGKLYAVFKDKTVEETFTKLDKEREADEAMYQ